MSKKKSTASSVVWFEIPADDPKRAQKFYQSMFGWKINPLQGVEDYWHIDTGGPDTSIDGGLMPRKHGRQPITSYISVASIAAAVKKVKKLGGEVCVDKSEVPDRGWFAICRDTEGNEFALWEMMK